MSQEIAADDHPGKGKRRHRAVKRSRGRTVLFAAVSIALPVVMLALVELVLWVAGAGVNTSFVERVATAGPNTYRLNPHADYPFYPAVDLAGPEARRFELPKPPTTFRIVALGASSVIGFPYPPQLAFPRQLEIVLEEQLDGVDVEVLNGGVTSIMSTTVTELAQSAVRCDPDAILVYTGHNEFYGPQGAASTDASDGPMVRRLLQRARRSRLVQLMQGGANTQQDRANLIEALPAETQLRLEGPVYRAALKTYRDNLNRLIKLANESKTPLLLSTVACNLRDQGPLHSLDRPADSEEWQRLIADGETLLRAGKFDDALTQLRSADDLFGGSARAAYALAQAFEGLERLEQARLKYIEARDEDGCRFRATSEFNEVVREVTAEASSHVTLVDIEDAIQNLAFPNAPGRELFLEHVHFTLHGHFEVAKSCAKTIRDQFPRLPWNDRPMIEEREVRTRLHVEPEDEMLALFATRRVMESAFFEHAVGSKQQQEWVTDRLQQLAELQPPQRAAVMLDMKVDDQGGHWAPLVAAAFEKRNDLPEATNLWQIAVARRPWLSDYQYNLGRLLASQGRFDEAIRHVAEAVRLKPDWVEADVLREALQDANDARP